MIVCNMKKHKAAKEIINMMRSLLDHQFKEVEFVQRVLEIFQEETLE